MHSHHTRNSCIALWLIENTALTFHQIAKCCSLPEVTVQGIADDIIKIPASIDPRELNLLSQEDITAAEQSAEHILKFKDMLNYAKEGQQKSLSQRQKKPCAIAWLIENCPGISINNIVSLVGTTANTVRAIVTKTHWNMGKIKPSYAAVREVCNQEQLKHIVLMSKISEDRNNMLSKIEAKEQGSNI